jgi:DNA-binding MarR family transcriptional regulator
MSRTPLKKNDEHCSPGVAFLLSQIGAHAAGKFAARLAPLKLAPSHAGILRVISADAGISQQKLAKFLGMFPSRLVLVLDEMEKAGLVERKASVADRRTYALQLAPKGREALQAIGRIAREHQEELCAALSPKERETLAALLSRIARHQHLTPGVHPGYKQIGRGCGRPC